MAGSRLREAVYKPFPTLPYVDDATLLSEFHQLPKQEKEVIRLSLGMGTRNHSYKEIGKMTKLHGGIQKPDQVLKIKERGLRTLRNRIREMHRK